jgi:hypothetical protein
LTIADILSPIQPVNAKPKVYKLAAHVETSDKISDKPPLDTAYQALHIDNLRDNRAVERITQNRDNKSGKHQQFLASKSSYEKLVQVAKTKLIRTFLDREKRR